MTKKNLIEKAIEDLKNTSSEDTETAHIQADDILCELLIKLGCTDVVNEFNKINKWYA